MEVSIIDKRKNALAREGRILKEALEKMLQGFVQNKRIAGFRFLNGQPDDGYLVLHTRYECIIRVCGENQRVTLVFRLDVRELTSKTVQIDANSKLGKFLLSPGFDPVKLSVMIHGLILGWKVGRRNEEKFATFLEELAQHPRIHQAYKTGSYDDKSKGIDFVVCFFIKPYWERTEVKFNLKSSSNFLEKHKRRHPTIGAFVFNSKADLANDRTKKALQVRFARFLLLSHQSTEPVHM